MPGPHPDKNLQLPERRRPRAVNANVRTRYFLPAALIITLTLGSSILPRPALAAGKIEAPRIPVLDILSANDAVPSNWIGIWTIHTTLRDCTTNLLIFDETVNDTLCADTSIEPDSTADFPVSCTTQFTSDSFSLVCDGTYPESDSCSVTYHQEYSGTIGSGSYTASGNYSFVFTGACDGIPDQCVNVATTGTRVSSDPGVCPQTPVESTSWGLLKSRYE